MSRASRPRGVAPVAGLGRGLVLALIVLGVLAFTPLERAFAGPRLEVRGASHFDARGVHATDSVAVSATLLDDVDRPMGDKLVTVRFTSDDGTVLRAWPCTPAIAAEETGGISLTTEPDGTLCARAEARRDGGTTTATLVFAGTNLVTGAHASVSIDPSRATVQLAFNPEPRSTRVLMRGEGPAILDAVATVDDPAASTAGLVLRLLDEHGGVLAEAATDAGGLARLIVPDAKLGPPGPATLRLQFDGDPRHGKAAHEIACERRVRVAIHPHETDVEGRAQGEETEDGATLELDVTSSEGLRVPGGSVEGLVDGAVVGAAPVADGRARLTLVHVESLVAKGRSPGERRPGLVVRYVPEVPWYAAGQPTALTLTVHHTLLWRRGVVVAVGLAIFVWFFLSRSRFLSATRASLVGAQTEGDSEAHLAHARIDVVAANEIAHAAWEGRVVDAHDGASVGGAIVAIERAGFASLETVAQTTSDLEGRFTLDVAVAAVRPGDQISAYGPLHARMSRPIPVRGVLHVALVSRRRAVLRRLIEWARRRGAPFHGVGEPTPAQIRRAAGDDGQIVQWASAVEATAFGHAQVDAQAEAEVDRLGHETDEPSR